MTAAVDTSIISELWAGQSRASQADMLLSEARSLGRVVISGIVYAELLAHPGASPKFVDQFLDTTRIQVDADLPKAVWRLAGIRYRDYSARRRASSANPGHRRLLADFVIGAHALLAADQLMTFNAADFRRDFPELKLTPTVPR